MIKKRDNEELQTLRRYPTNRAYPANEGSVSARENGPGIT